MKAPYRASLARTVASARILGRVVRMQMIRPFVIVGDMPRLLVVVAALSSAVLSAQADWTQLAPAVFPSPRAGAVGVSDGALLYNFGGKPGPGVELNDMWVFDGANWIDITPASGALPPGRDFYAATFDTTRGVYVLFGGRSSALSSDLGDTWEFDGATWAQAAPAVSPGARRWCQMAYDPIAGACILFGGYDGTNYLSDTWRWDGATWTPLSPSNSPSPRARGRLSYDLSRGEMIYFGGRNAAGALSDTWRWDGADWSQVTTASNPPSSGGVAGRFAYGMTYDYLRDRHVLFGGTRNGPTLSDTWEFDGVDWVQRSASGPINRTGPTFAYVLGLQKAFLFGGFTGPQQDDTWNYESSTVGAVTQYGAGCSGPGGLLTLSSTELPWTGDTWTATCSTLGATSLSMAVWGLAAAALPLNAALPVAPLGCDLLNTGDFLFGPSLPAGGVAQAQLAIPNSAALGGATLYLQVAELEFSVTGGWSGLYTSNGLAVDIGLR